MWFVVLNLGFRICLAFGICDLDFSKHTGSMDPDLRRDDGKNVGAAENDNPPPISCYNEFHGFPYVICLRHMYWELFERGGAAL